MLPRRLYQFLLIFLLGLAVLIGLKYSLGLSDYVIPSPKDVWHTAGEVFFRYIVDVLDTLKVAVIGQEAECVYGDPKSFAVEGADAEKGAFVPPMLFRCADPAGGRRCGIRRGHQSTTLSPICHIAIPRATATPVQMPNSIQP